MEELFSLNKYCTRCILRYSVENVYQVFESEQFSPVTGCGLCLDVLSDENIEKTVLSIVEQLKKYEAPLYTLAIQLPQCILIRAYFCKTKNSQPEVTNQVMEDFLSNLKESEISKYISFPPLSVRSLCTFSVNTCQESIFIAGRYNKYSRELSQTPWIIEGERKTESSVQDLICGKMQEAVQASDNKFISSGREDVDVLMLGKGRPFAVELINPKVSGLERNIVQELQDAINKSTDLISVRDLQVMHRGAIQKLKEGEEEKKKLYRARIWCPLPISAEKIDSVCILKNIVLMQKTPIRVLHRRPLITRERTIYETNLTRVDEFHYDLFITTQAGTYVKEFVHGDFGRTNPSLRTLLNADVDILELDVQNVEFDWPPSCNDVNCVND
nr:tRNA pseudouridine synthase Pus10 isoform X2 [Hydra vulgaris]